MFSDIAANFILKMFTFILVRTIVYWCHKCGHLKVLSDISRSICQQLVLKALQ